MPESLRKGYLAVASFVFLSTLAVYAITVTPSIPFWDSGEFIATSHLLGIPHPPGTPLYVLIGRLFAFAAQEQSDGTIAPAELLTLDPGPVTLGVML